MTETIKRLKELREKATQGAWERVRDTHGCGWNYTGIAKVGGKKRDRDFVISYSDNAFGSTRKPENEEYIVALHNSLPDLLTYIEELERKVAAGRKLAEAVSDVAQVGIYAKPVAGISNMKLKNEAWEPIKGYEGLYEVSNLGKVKSLVKPGAPIERILKYWMSGRKGRRYPYVSLTKGNKKKGFLIHRLVAVAFIPNPLNKPFVNHIDGNKLNNRHSNLEWCTTSENQKHAYRTGLMNNAGDRNGNWKGGISKRWKDKTKPKPVPLAGCG